MERWSKDYAQCRQTAKCGTLIPGQIYAALFYNAAQNQQNTTVQVALGNKHVKPVVVPGTTANQGLAAVALFTGSDSTVVSASVLVGAGTPTIEAWLGSVSMPTDTSGIDNKPLPPDGQFHEFGKAVRYFAVPPSRNCFVTIRSLAQMCDQGPVVVAFIVFLDFVFYLTCSMT
ncbi:MAG TPA: hypothetical protein VG649_04075, partial [Candidatus Angelobacter sp.]|nr:hypothetical protein [Candidatus Angelobacter sp.]